MSVFKHHCCLFQCFLPVFFFMCDFPKNKAFDAGWPNMFIQSERLPLVKFTGYFIVSDFPIPIFFTTFSV